MPTVPPPRDDSAPEMCSRNLNACTWQAFCVTACSAPNQHDKRDMICAHANYRDRCPTLSGSCSTPLQSGSPDPQVIPDYACLHTGVCVLAAEARASLPAWRRPAALQAELLCMGNDGRTESVWSQTDRVRSSANAPTSSSAPARAILSASQSSSSSSANESMGRLAALPPGFAVACGAADAAAASAALPRLAPPPEGRC